MKVTSAWLQEWLGRTILSTDELVSALVQSGLEVEQVISSKSIDKNVVVCSVKKVMQHPNAERLHIVEVETPEGEYSVVCGAPNVREGLKVPFAQIGAILPGGETITRVKLRGEVSNGMLCSEFELGLGSDHSGILELDESTPIGTPLSALFPADTIIDLKTPANRSDVQSIWGVAREVAAMLDTPLQEPTLPAVPFTSDKAIVDESPAVGVGRWVKLSLEHPLPASPAWMQARLRAAGMRPVSLLVDITNYVMLEYGQPLHAYDAARVSLPLSARLARSGEQLTLLDGAKLKLGVHDAVIADSTGPVALAGVMGGASTEVTDDTREIWLEAAQFEAVRTRKSAKAHGLRTEASGRFERGLPAELTEVGIARAVGLLQELAGATVDMAIVAGQPVTPPREITLNVVQTSKLLGFQTTADEMMSALGRLQIKTVQNSKELIAVPAVPWWRPDIRDAIDVVEEIVRVLGYDRVPATLPQWRPQAVPFDRRRSRLRLVRDVLYGAGLFEVMTYSFVSQDQLETSGLSLSDHLKLKNPLSVEQAYLRSSLLASHLTVAERNRTYRRELAFYEISKVFLKAGSGELPQEPLRLGVMLLRREGGYLHLKGVLDTLARELSVELEYEPVAQPSYAPYRSAQITLNGAHIGVIGQLHPRLVRSHKLAGEAAFVELDLEPLIEAARPRQFAALDRYPVIRRDVALWVPQDVTWTKICQAADGFGLEFVDQYAADDAPAGMRGVTVRLTIRQPDRTPTEAEAQEREAQLLVRLEHKLKARRRS